MNVTSAYLNGQWVSGAELNIPADDVGFLLGATVSERLRTFGGRIFRLAEHLERLCHSLEIIGLDSRSICGEVEAVLPEVAGRGCSHLAVEDDVGVVVFVTPPGAGSADRQQAYGTLAVYAAPLAFADWAHKYDCGERLVISDHRQVPRSCWPSELKCRSRMHYYLADLQARQRDPDARALVLDQEGRVAEASTANVLVVRQDKLLSPRPEGILPGVSLGFLQELAHQEEIPFEFAEITPRELPVADEMLLTSTSPCLLPVCSFNGTTLGGGRPGPVFERLIEAWGQSVGKDIRQQAVRFAARA